MNENMTGKISFVATPIGNLRDITFRAIETLREADIILCEDTRVSSKLLAAFEISKPLISVHEHSSDDKLDALVREAKDGKRYAYICDAGTPGMNDPGGKLAERAFASGVTVVPIPGPSAVTAAISSCGFPMDEFTYHGFAPHKKGRKSFFEEMLARKSPSIFLESTHRILKTLEQLEEIIDSNRLIYVGRELTKMHETVYRGTISEVRQSIEKTSTKGEFIVIIGPKPKK
ncbi:16S rRNA (cytidine(1402)-2'-O)-methyltransferase [Candidatus Uhrbacteria bacterium]|nr:16S rRNA (cytidine(1402)-2'-O)-methyltransferase [Candidatus Uhrbacteria bacterium]